MSKKILSVLLVFALLFALTSVSALADPPTGSITINNTNPNISINTRTYSAYKVFNATTDGVGGYSYTLATEFAGFATAMGYDPLAMMFAIQANDGSATKTIQEFARDLEVFATSYLHNPPSGLAPTGTGVGAVVTTTPFVEKAVISNLPYGYYLVTGRVVDEFTGGLDGDLTSKPANILMTVDGDVETNIKGDAPHITKKVWDVKDDTDPDNTLAPRWQDVTDVNVGDTVIFKMESFVPDTTYYSTYTYIMYDDMEDGLTFDPTSVKVYLGGTLTATGGVTGGTLLVSDSVDPIDPDYTLNTFSGTSSFNIEFHKIMDYTKDQKIYVIYEAELNQDAILFDPGNLNSAQLRYSNDPYDDQRTAWTPEDCVIVYSFAWQMFKYAATEDDADPDNPYADKLALKDAEFKVYKQPASVSTRTPLNLVLVTAGTATAEAVYRLAKTGETAGVTDTIIVPESGKVFISGIDEGTYYLKETLAPLGYNLLEDDVVIKLVIGYDFDELDGYILHWSWAGTGMIDPAISSSYFQVGDGTKHVITQEQEADPETGEVPPPVPIFDALTAWILNNSGDKLPETGGMGTTIFTIGGLALMMAAGVVLMVRRKATARREY